MIYGYVRVSTDKQTLENQEFEINNFCEQEHIKIDKWITETISGTKDFEKRKLGRVLKKLKSGDILIRSEISRLGRNLLQIMISLQSLAFREDLSSTDVRLWTHYRLKCSTNRLFINRLLH